MERVLLAIFVIALAIRCLVLLELRGSDLLDVTLGDGRQYQAWASEIAAGDWLGHEVFYQAPLYPYFLAVLFKLFGPRMGPVLFTQAVLGALSCLLLVMAGRRFLTPKIGLLAGLLLAFYPPAIFFDTLVQKASLGLFLTCALLALLGEVSLRFGKGLWIVVGATLGCLVLIRENALILAPVILVWAWLDSPRAAGKSWARAALFVIGLSSVLVPVGLRNLAIGGQFLVTTSQMGTNFFIGNNLEADGRYRPLRPGRQDARVESDDARYLAEQAVGGRLSPGEVSSYWFARTLEEIRSEPQQWARLLVKKTFLLVNRQELVDSQSIEASSDHSRVLAGLVRLLTFGIIGPLAILGLFVTRDRWRRLLILYGFSVAIAVSLVLFYVMARYRLPLVPVTMIFTAAGLLALIEQASNRAWRDLSISCVMVMVAAGVQNAPLTISTSPRATTYYNLGITFFEHGDDVKARANLEKVVLLMPGFADGHVSLGRVLAAQGDVTGALQHLHDALRIDPLHADAHFRLARLLTHQAKGHEALEHYEKALAIEPKNAAFLHHFGFLMMSTGELDKAADLLRRALEVDSELAIARNLLGNILVAQGHRTEAIQAYERALEDDPTLVDAHFKLGLLLAEDGRFELARVHFEETAELRPGFLDGHLGLAGVLEALGNRAEAADHYRQVLRLRDDDAATMTLLARLLTTASESAIRDSEEAVSLAERACQITTFADRQMMAVLLAACAAAEAPERADEAAREAAELASVTVDDELARLVRQRLAVHRSRALARGQVKDSGDS